MHTFHGERTCTANISTYLPENYGEITHNTVAQMLVAALFLEETHTFRYLRATDSYRFALIQEIHLSYFVRQNTKYYPIHISNSNQTIMTKLEYLLKTFQ